MIKASILVLVLALGATSASADPANIAVADLGLHVIGVGVQHTVAPRVALQADLDYYAPWTELLADGRPQFAIAGGIVRARVFVYLDAAPTGWWLSPFAQGGYAHGAGGDDGAVAAGGASIGYTWLFARRYELAFGVGAQYHVAHAAPEFSGVWPHADLNLGYAF